MDHRCRNEPPPQCVDAGISMAKKKQKTAETHLDHETEGVGVNGTITGPVGRRRHSFIFTSCRLWYSFRAEDSTDGWLAGGNESKEPVGRADCKQSAKQKRLQKATLLPAQSMIIFLFQP